ncbi:MAG: hypothetical protein SNJ72_00055 [Fimbriimonadales bacterium]
MLAFAKEVIDKNRLTNRTYIRSKSRSTKRPVNRVPKTKPQKFYPVPSKKRRLRRSKRQILRQRVLQFMRRIVARPDWIVKLLEVIFNFF